MVPSTSRLPARDLLFASSLVMTCVGLLPLLEFARRAQSTPLATATYLPAGSEPPSTLLELLSLSLAALTPVDRSALVVCGVVALLGVGLLVLQLAPPLAAASTLRTLRLASLGVAAAVAVAAVALSLATDAPPKPASPWHSELLAANELAFEQQVNDLYCHAKGQHVCDLGSIADARQVFPLRQWPVGTDSQPGKRVAAACESFEPAVMQWGYPGKMQVCRVCADIRAHREQQAAALSRQQQNQQLELEATDPVAELLQAVPRLSVGEQMWCGEYLAQLSDQAVDSDELQLPPKMPEGAGLSPFRAHRAAFRELLGPVEAPRAWALQSAGRALQVLLVASAVSGYALRKWMVQLSALGGASKKLPGEE